MWINSFAHGRTVYELKYGVAAVEKIIEKASDNEAVSVFVRLVIGADLETHDRERLRDAINARTGTKKRTIDQAIAQARKEHEGRQKQEEQGPSSGQSSRPATTYRGPRTRRAVDTAGASDQ